MKRTFLMLAFAVISAGATVSQTLYVDPAKGADTNSGAEMQPFATLEKAVSFANGLTGSGAITIRLLPGLYSLNDKVAIHPLRVLSDTVRFTIEAAVMPGDPGWTPLQMPVIQSVSGNNSSTQFLHSTGILVAASHVTIRGLKFLGNSHPEVPYYYPISKENEAFGDMEVSQCYFISEVHSSQIQGAIWAQGPNTSVRNCIFYNCRNAILLFRSVEDFSITNSIIYGCNESAVWMGQVERFTFTNNVVANCHYFWVRPDKSTPKYRFSNSIIAGNEHYLGYYTSNGLVETSDNKNVVEENVVKNGQVKLVMRTGPEFPVDYLHVSKESAGHELKAGVLGK